MPVRSLSVWTLFGLLLALGACAPANRRTGGTEDIPPDDQGEDDDGDGTREPVWNDEVCGDGNDNDQDGHAEEDCPCAYQ